MSQLLLSLDSLRAKISERSLNKVGDLAAAEL